MKTDIQIAQEAVMEPITKVAESLQIKADELELYESIRPKFQMSILLKLPPGQMEN